MSQKFSSPRWSYGEAQAEFYGLAIADEFRAPKWIESIKYPELIMQQVKQFLYAH